MKPFLNSIHIHPAHIILTFSHWQRISADPLYTIYFILLNPLHGQADSLLLHIHSKYSYIHHIPDRNCLKRMFNISLTHLGDMHQSILMNTDIHKCPEINDITDSSLKDHTFFEVFHIKYICTKYRFRHLITWISCRFFQFFYNIAKCRLTDSQLFCKLLIVLNLF